MGCQSSKAVDCVVPDKAGVPVSDRCSIGSGSTETSNGDVASDSTDDSSSSAAQEMSQSQHVSAHARLQKLRDLDASTKVPFILIELRGDCPGKGFVEICGKDEYGVYRALDDWLTRECRCRKIEHGDFNLHTLVPFADAVYEWKGFLTEGGGANNMGLVSMRLVDFMCNTLSWTLGVINGGNLGSKGEIREQQIIFKAPHPMNLVAKHAMIELRSAGFIEVCSSDKNALKALDGYFVNEWRARQQGGHELYSDQYYSCQNDTFKQNENGDNNLGLLTTQVCDAVVKLLQGWSLVTMNGGNCGEDGTEREQQLVFRCDCHPLREAPHLCVQLRDAGYIEVDGQNVDGIHEKFQDWLLHSKSDWGCKSPQSEKVSMIPFRRSKPQSWCSKLLAWSPQDMLTASADVTSFFQQEGWQVQACSQGTVQVRGCSDSREQQILFRPGYSATGILEPHVFVELYMGEGKSELYSHSDRTQVLANQRIRIRAIGDCEMALKQLHDFILEYLGGRLLDSSEGAIYSCDVFLCRGLNDNNLGCWTMRLGDFMVDRLGWSLVVCNVCNLGPEGQYREQQLAFRYDGDHREMPPAVNRMPTSLQKDNFARMQFPSYWTSRPVLTLQQMMQIVPCTKGEEQAMQRVFDRTFKRILTRDRVYEPQQLGSEEMPYRLEVVQVFRSEHAELYRQFRARRSQYHGGTHVHAKTHHAGTLLNERLSDGDALLFHGTSPSAAMNILKSGFNFNHAGSATGTMFGNGIYLAECTSKADEYAKDDTGNTFPGLRAILVCRCLVGNPHVVDCAGDHIDAAKSTSRDCILGDREAKVGTYREFVFFDERQIFPEYAVIYRRQYDHEQVPTPMRVSTTGTTGRNWQVRLDRGWRNLGADVSHELNQTQRAGQPSLVREIAKHKYRFDVATMTQVELDTGKVCMIRPPLRS